MASKNARKAKAATSRRRTRKKGNGKLEQPMSPLPAQHQPKPGIEAKLKPRPRYEAPFYSGSGKLKQKVALVTGGDSGIGRAVAVLFAREGADVAFTFLKEEKQDAEETKRAIEAEGRRAYATRRRRKRSESLPETRLSNHRQVWKVGHSGQQRSLSTTPGEPRGRDGRTMGPDVQN